jgi:hypothetical protein
MVIGIVFATLLAVLYIGRRHSGPAHLATIAGLSVHELFGTKLAKELAGVIHINGLTETILNASIYILLVLIFPLILYIRSNKGVGGLSHIIQSVVFAILLAALIIEPMSKFFPIDGLSLTINTQLSGFIQYIVVAGIIAAYIDILVYNSKID